MRPFPERSGRRRELFLAALELAPEERTAFLDRECPEPELRLDVLSLLAAYERAGSFLEAPLPGSEGDGDSVAAEELEVELERLIGERVGAWRLTERLGEGGMGVVYLGERDDGAFAQKVAVKLLRPGTVSGPLLRRFHAERATLARLEHPNVARLLDGGTTATGLPYLVMEHVDGLPIDAWCDERRLDVPARLRLFLQVCEAVQHAHRHLVVHRDLKPSNILVDEHGNAKLLDFGIAAFLPGSDLATTRLTRAQQLVFTPEYASPEQIRGEPVSTATDVYALGLLLYELLVGRLPYPAAGATLGELARLVCEVEPERASTAVVRLGASEASGGTGAVSVAASRVTTPRRLRRRLRGDLDNVLTMALRKEPERRYPSVERFAEDIRRHLAGLPVSARPERLLYLTGKFVRRHRVAVAASLLAALGLLGGLATAAWQARVAERQRALAEDRFEQVRQLADSLLFELHDAIADLPGATPARRLLVQRALVYLDRLAAETAGDEALERDLATAYERVGGIQGNPHGPNLGETEAALRSYAMAVELRERLLAANPGDSSLLRELSNVRQAQGDLLGWTGDTEASLASYRTALWLRRRLLADAADDIGLRRAVAETHMSRGGVLNWNGRSAEAVADLDQAVALLESALDAAGPDGELLRHLTQAYLRRADARSWAGDADGALADSERAERTAAHLAAAVDDAPAQRLRWLIALQRAELLRDRSAAEGAVAYRAALPRAEALAAADPANAQAQRDLAVNRARLADALADAGDHAAALEQAQGALTIQRQLAAQDPATPPVASTSPTAKRSSVTCCWRAAIPSRRCRTTAKRSTCARHC
jgi:eukaryotic-like serine/threonine-protein kinase